MNATMPPLIGQITERIRGISEHYPAGESTGTAATVLAILVGIVVFAWLLTRRQQSASAARITGDPHRLFADLMREMVLPFPQRQLLSTMARAMKLDHPSALLLSPALFETAVRRIGRGSINAEYRAKLVHQLRRKLFEVS